MERLEHGRKLLRAGVRRWVWLGRRGKPSILAAPIAMVMLANGFSLLTHPFSESGPLRFPLFFGYWLFLLGLLGLLGITFKSAHSLAFFAFGGLLVRSWMAALYFMRDSTDLAWFSFAFGAASLAWIFGRVVCDMTHRAKMREKPRRARGEVR